jgi:hypothetical protein
MSMLPPAQDHRSASAERDAVLAIVRDFRLYLERHLNGHELALQPGSTLGLELWLKLAAESLLPALRDAEVPPASELRTALRQIDELRELARLHGEEPARLAAPVRDHLQRTESLLGCADATQLVDWPRLRGDVLAWMARWQQEIDATGDIEDEDRDPVGEPPR